MFFGLFGDTLAILTVISADDVLTLFTLTNLPVKFTARGAKRKACVNSFILSFNPFLSSLISNLSSFLISTFALTSAFFPLFPLFSLFSLAKAGDKETNDITATKDKIR